MEEVIVKIENDEPRVSTWDLALGFEVDHRQIKRHIENFIEEFQELGFIASGRQQINRKRGRQIEDLMLNEQQATYLATLLSNNDAARRFKLKLTKQFYKMREALMKIANQRQNAEWIAKREQGKIERRVETDSIKAFIEYAKAQGSKNADKYYMIFTKMENQSLVNLELLKQEFDNIREVVDLFSLNALQMADYIVATAIKEGMKLEMFYKDIYLRAKEKVEAFALSIGKTPLRLALKEQKEIL